MSTGRARLPCWPSCRRGVQWSGQNSANSQILISNSGAHSLMPIDRRETPNTAGRIKRNRTNQTNRTVWNWEANYAKQWRVGPFLVSVLVSVLGQPKLQLKQGERERMDNVFAACRMKCIARPKWYQCGDRIIGYHWISFDSNAEEDSQRIGQMVRSD